MNPEDRPSDGGADATNRAQLSTSEVGSFRQFTGTSSTPPNPTSNEEQWRMMFELQQRNMMKLIEAMRPSTQPTSLPEFNPEIKDADARAWCSTIDICMAERPLEGGALIMTLSKSLKGSASSWLSQVAHPGMTWLFFKDLFLCRYDSAETVAATLININNGRPKDGECLAAYASRIMTSVVAKWKNMTPEEIAISYVLAHTAQFDTRLHHLAYTTEITTRSKLLQEMKSFSALKRKNDREPQVDTKRIKFSTPETCHYCKKVGHKLVDCRRRKFNTQQSNTAVSTTGFNMNSTPSPTVKKSVICFTCGEKGHIATHCPKIARRGPSSSGASGAAGSNAGATTSGQQRRVDSCEIQGVSGHLEHAGVIWETKGPLPRTGDFFKLMKKHGKTVNYVSNNSLRPQWNYENNFKAAGIEDGYENLTIPSIAIAEYLKSINFKKTVYCVCCLETKNVLESYGLKCDHGPDVIQEQYYTEYVKYLKDDPEIGAVIFDSDFKVNIPKLYRASTYLSRSDVHFINGATDKYVPLKHGQLAIGAGAFTDLVVEQTGREAIQLGKPGRMFGEFAMKRAGVSDPSRVLFIGDMIDQDVAMGKACGFKTLLLLTNLTEDTMRSHDIKSDYYAPSLESLVSKL